MTWTLEVREPYPNLKQFERYVWREKSSFSDLSGVGTDKYPDWLLGNGSIAAVRFLGSDLSVLVAEGLNQSVDSMICLVEQAIRCPWDHSVGWAVRTDAPTDTLNAVMWASRFARDLKGQSPRLRVIVMCTYYVNSIGASLAEW
jgi:hypothetical protein